MTQSTGRHPAERHCREDAEGRDEDHIFFCEECATAAGIDLIPLSDHPLRDRRVAELAAAALAAEPRNGAAFDLAAVFGIDLDEG